MTSDPRLKMGPPEEQYREAFSPYAAAIGELVFAWNALHDNLAKLFELVVASRSREMGMAIWFSTDSDYSQRKMLRAAVNNASQLTKAQVDDIVWMLNKIEGDLRHNRNDAIHSPFAFVHGIPGDTAIFVIPAFMSNSPRARSLSRNAGHDLKKYLEEQTQLADALAEFVRKICNSILAPVIHSWPEKPKLPHAHRKKSREGSSRQNIAK